MFSKIALIVVTVVFIFAAGRGWAEETQDQKRARALKLQKDGNFNEAYKVFSALALDTGDDALKVPDDLKNAMACLQRLNREEEVDDFREKVIAVHAANWRLLRQAAQSYSNGQHMGYIVAGKFNRGHKRGEGRYVNSLARDRVRAMQLYREAMLKGKDEPDKKALSQLYSEIATALMLNGYSEAWRLQDLTELDKLPDYDEGYYGRGRGYGGSSRGAPVNADGTPIYYSTPKSFDAAANDGERWRFCLMQAEELDGARAPELRLSFAQFLQNQFDVRSMSSFGRFGGFASEDDDKANESGPFAVKTLGENETIARLANGIKRFKLPDEFNFIKIYQTIADQWKGNTYAGMALIQLASLFEDRQQYDRAVEFWKRSIAEHGDTQHQQDRIDQILGNWGVFDSVPTQPAGGAATIGFRFRNGDKASFEATEVNVAKLIEDIKTYIKGKPRNIDWGKINVENIGYRLVTENQTQYLGEKAASWSLDLKPREKHYDRHITVETPLKKAGAYFVVAKMANGNTSRVVMWIADTAIVKKQLDKQTYLYVADAVSGKPVANPKLDFFGYWQQWNNNNVQITTSEVSQTGDGQGQLFLDNDKLNHSYSWIITATTPDGRFANLGFTGIWGQPWYDQEYNQVKTFGITDRPVYRPDQAVKFKFWVGYAKYDQKGPYPYAGQPLKVEIYNPKGEKFHEKDYVADAFGGIDGEIKLDKQATLGQYYINVQTVGGSVGFRLEEYKKPEFEVKVDAPAEPVALGEKIGATVTAKYYFGAPVANAKVKYKVTRSDHSATYYPAGNWDWFYEPGYWWFAYDYPWYPGWREWGMRRPSPWWWNRAHTPPELVSENEVPLNPDGTFKIEIDSAVAKALHPDTDHRYEITAEITDASRRTIVGSGSVIAARKPFKVYTWVDRGFYRAGDAIQADFSAQTVDNKPVKGKGALKLLQVSYDKDGKPSEKAVQEWALDTNEEGKARQQIKAAEPGQYRLSYTVTDEKKHVAEGGYVFVIRGEGFTGGPFRFNDLELIPDKREYAPGEKVKLMVNADRENTTVLLFPRASNGVCVKPTLLHLNGKSAVEELDVALRDMPNFFVEAATVSGGKVFMETKEIVVPPESRVLNVTVLPSATEFKPGQKAKVKVQLTDTTGEPVKGSSTVSVYDKSVEYISGGSNVQEIKSFFWKWRRHHYPQSESSLNKHGQNLLQKNEKGMGYIGAFGALLSLERDEVTTREGKPGIGGGFGGGRGEMRKAVADGGAMDAVEKGAAMAAAPMAKAANRALESDKFDGNANGIMADAKAKKQAGQGGVEEEAMAETSVRSNFADTAFWSATLNSDDKGIAEFELDMPESLTTWKMKVWTMSSGTRVGQGEVEVITKKNVIIRLQSPRFFTQNDEVVLSAFQHSGIRSLEFT